VVFKGKKDGIFINLDNTASFEDIKKVFASKVIDAKKFFGESKTSIIFQGRELSESEETQLLDIVSKESDLTISFVKSVPYLTKDNKAKENKDQEKNKELYAKENITLYHSGILRSGQTISYDGSVVIYGDVNPGSCVKAKGNITIFGTAKGVVHAGCDGNEECFVSALCLVPIQLKIADIITYMPKEVAAATIKASKQKPMPSYAFVKDSQIYIQPLD
jgi:septum site-determining protein MinC